ncbi:CRISPR-associated helicase Cas3' [Cellulomonas xiejunii]|uniref:CRISPR-associated helicase Cas3' n=1 Tax=Cellulomonas xiejunii TaxID=2968083 RepID=UPI001D0DE460|nr:CRISPR-associated helicase Cas3' [Cellulomonas xiejunii]MCC2323513.1 CRISPR-associated helicase Cas3' [Cellulomonas xiejunii]
MQRVDVDVDEMSRAAWGKSWPYATPPTHWAPLWRHLDETADVAGLLVDEWLADDIRRLLTDATGADLADARRLVRFLAGVHDVGKASPAFACQVALLSDRMRAVGLRTSPATLNERTALRHEIAGAAALERWLATRTSLAPRMRRRLTAVVAGHHGAYASFSAVRDAPNRDHLIGDAPWLALQDALVDRAAARAGITPAWPGWDLLRLPGPAAMLLTGVVVMADWIASADTSFPLDPVDVVAEPAPVTTSPSPRSLRAWRRLQLSPRWTAPASHDDPAATFAARFPGVAGALHPVQRAVVDTARTMPAPGLLVVEAPMGSGKTEAALLAAEVLAHRTGAGGVFVALPTQATTDAMYGRVRDWLTRVPAGDAAQHSLALVHGKAALNDDATGLPPLRVVNLHDKPEGSDGRYVVPAADLWMRGRKRTALASFVVGTIDQVLFASLMARHVMMRQLALASKVVVIDEVHAADTYMGTYLERAVEWLGACGTPVVLLSATLPAARRAELYGAYETGRRLRLGLDVDDVDTSALDGDIGYPAVVATGADGPCVVRFADVPTTAQVQVSRLDDDLDALGDLLAEALRDGGCAAVIRNTVARAQEAARYLETRFGPDVVTVAHAQFLATDRRANDLRLLAELGRDGARPALRIVVGTQVLEQSLDIDVDLMVTDLAPVDLVLQRVGRLHRHRRPDRPAPVAAPRCYVTGADWTRHVPQPVRGSVFVYGRYALLASAAVLGPHLDGEPVRLPHDIARLVQAAYAPGTPAPTGWEEAWATAAVQAEHDEAGRRKRAGDFLLSPPSGNDLYGASVAGVGDVDEDSPQGQACVREGTDSIEVVVVQRSAGGADRVPDWAPGGGTALPFPHVPLEDDVARLLGRCTLRLPARMTLRAGSFDRVVRQLEDERFDGWDASPLLKGQLGLVLDDSRCARLDGFDLHYDQQYGLTATPVEASP